ncbi:MAG: type I glyceraldehyde-3-phosphate dehydrogenase [Candidatus Dadabacteria bacterium]|nr:type I glyceraldehyde-3-phosphate dehydrogenase [Candidatus Dadabacteria bacterium]MYA47915.1 type I glyceraldehyde-3-phosphate dehydrogenase [Candidatus Dadabacteria bacterium]MYF48317.1 type I glyceraldehyde-3-phosphate dehydrogenase [Candidatus Dadabacteria bacterium]MYG83068.1 type I glyceraldehyde-3-phosphate dehydrogenase [Candidatus Dadabacteria bacterium]MYK49305.1 type I glyceraldehyde-3-phosphate dehydrogenase [Candidatus Dadabacteria bacterium]
MSIRVGINGFGRIGRHVLRIGLGREDLEFVGINDITDTETLAHLFKYDSVFGRYPGEVGCDGEGITVDGKFIRVFSERNPANIPWTETGAQVVTEASGIFRTREAAAAHMGETVKKVIITAPASGEVDFTTVMGINDQEYEPGDHDVISNASCTTNCFGMLVKVLHENFAIRRGEMTTIHSYTNDQRILDTPHKDKRRARAAALSIIPTSTGAANAIQLVFPELKGKLSAVAVRVPTPNVSLVDFTCEVEKGTSADEVNSKFKEAAEGTLSGYLAYVEDEIVSSDLVGDTHSCSFDSMLTSVVEDSLVKVVAWYDNEYGYTSRVVDLIELVGRGL